MIVGPSILKEAFGPPPPMPMVVKALRLLTDTKWPKTKSRRPRVYIRTLCAATVSEYDSDEQWIFENRTTVQVSSLEDQ